MSDVKYFNLPKAIFENRADAGRQLAEMLTDYLGRRVVVLAIPNGGVPVGMEVARALKADFDLIICRKIPMPLMPEAGFGAIVDDGTTILNEELVRRTGLSPEQVEYEANRVRAEIKRRIMLYRKDRPNALVGGRTVIIIDDGLASGITMRAAVASMRHRRPREIVVAVPCASISAFELLQKEADAVVTCAIGTAPRFAVADFYRHWHDISDEDTLRVLERWRSDQFWSYIEPPKGRGG